MSYSMLTTRDNPYDPSTQWDHWLAYDRQMGHKTLEILAAHTVVSEEMTPELYQQAVRQGMVKVVAELPETYKIITIDKEVEMFSSPKKEPNSE